MWNQLPNLAGSKTEAANERVRWELERAGIPYAQASSPVHGEVPATLYGILSKVRFVRAWTYWIVEGLVPREVAEVLYRDPVGHTDIRVRGDCSCPPPNDRRLTYYDPDGYTLIPLKEHEEIERFASNLPWLRAKIPQFRAVEDPAAAGLGFVTSYHIDSEVGLRIFADAIRALQIRIEPKAPVWSDVKA